mgnify:CR=1 FL=1
MAALDLSEDEQREVWGPDPDATVHRNACHGGWIIEVVDHSGLVRACPTCATIETDGDARAAAERAGYKINARGYVCGVPDGATR